MKLSIYILFMVTNLIEILANFVISVIGFFGYAGVFVLMLAESCGIPMPSEVIMPFSGFLVAKGQMNFWVVVFLGAVGNLVGSLLAYYIGAKGGRPLLEKYGKYVLISKEMAEANKLPVEDGALVVREALGESPVVKDSAADKAGIKEWDIILECNGDRITIKNPLGHILQKCKIGQETTFKVLRDGKELNLKAKMEEKI
jgi:membrane-associated protease RseP (regulator of RpoE activity)